MLRKSAFSMAWFDKNCRKLRIRSTSFSRGYHIPRALVRFDLRLMYSTGKLCRYLLHRYDWNMSFCSFRALRGSFAYAPPCIARKGTDFSCALTLGSRIGHAKARPAWGLQSMQSERTRGECWVFANHLLAQTSPTVHSEKCSQLPLKVMQIRDQRYPERHRAQERGAEQ